MKKLHVSVSNRLRVDLAEATDVLGEESLRGLRKAFEHKNYMWHKLRAMGYSPYREPQFLVTWTVEDEGRTLSFPRGGTDRIRSFAERESARIVWRDLRAGGDPGLTPIPEHRIVIDGEVFELWPHQRSAIDAVAARENCYVRSPTASGKTTLLLALVAQIGRPTLVIVGSNGLRDEWMERCLAELRFEAGIIQGKKRVLRPVTVAMRQTLDRYGVDDELKQKFGCLLFDEMQGVPSKTSYDIVDSFPARFRIAASANEGRVDHKECLTYDLFGQLAADIDGRELVQQGIIIAPKVIAVPTDFRAEWLSAEPSFMADTRSGEIGRDYKRFLDELVADEARNALIMQLAQREIAAGEQVLILTLRVEHALMLRKQILDAGTACGLLVGEYPREFPITVKGIRDGSLRVSVGTVQATGTAINLPRLSAGILALPLGKENSYLFGQVKGRFCRAPRGKTEARLYVPVDLAVSGTAVLRRLQRWQEASGIGDMAVLDREHDRLISVTEYIRRPKVRTRQ